MQYQLEHHLFPTMPRYKYRELVPLVKRFAEENDIEYRATGQWNILRDNINLVRATDHILVSYGTTFALLVATISCLDIPPFEVTTDALLIQCSRASLFLEGLFVTTLWGVRVRVLTVSFCLRSQGKYKRTFLTSD